MTEKEKAQKLIDQYKEILNIRNDMRPGVNPFAQACAIYAVDLMLAEFKDIEFNYGYQLIDDLDYWGKVKQELEAMK